MEPRITGDRLVFKQDNHEIISIKKYGAKIGWIKAWLGDNLLKFLPNFGAIKVNLTVDGKKKDIYLDKRSVVKHIISDLAVSLRPTDAEIVKCRKDIGDCVVNKIKDMGIEKLVENLAQVKNKKVTGCGTNYETRVFLCDKKEIINQFEFNSKGIDSEKYKQYLENERLAEEIKKREKEVTEQFYKEVAQFKEKLYSKFGEGTFVIDPRTGKDSGIDFHEMNLNITHISFMKMTDEEFKEILELFKNPYLKSIDFSQTRFEGSKKDIFVEFILNSKNLAKIYLSSLEPKLIIEGSKIEITYIDPFSEYRPKFGVQSPTPYTFSKGPYS